MNLNTNDNNSNFSKTNDSRTSAMEIQKKYSKKSNIWSNVFALMTMFFIFLGLVRATYVGQFIDDILFTLPFGWFKYLVYPITFIFFLYLLRDYRFIFKKRFLIMLITSFSVVCWVISSLLILISHSTAHNEFGIDKIWSEDILVKIISAYIRNWKKFSLFGEYKGSFFKTNINTYFNGYSGGGLIGSILSGFASYMSIIGNLIISLVFLFFNTCWILTGDPYYLIKPKKERYGRSLRILSLTSKRKNTINQNKMVEFLNFENKPIFDNPVDPGRRNYDLTILPPEYNNYKGPDDFFDKETNHNMFVNNKPINGITYNQQSDVYNRPIFNVGDSGYYDVMKHSNQHVDQFPQKANEQVIFSNEKNDLKNFDSNIDKWNNPKNDMNINNLNQILPSRLSNGANYQLVRNKANSAKIDANFKKEKLAAFLNEEISTIEVEKRRKKILKDSNISPFEVKPKIQSTIDDLSDDYLNQSFKTKETKVIENITVEHVPADFEEILKTPNKNKNVNKFNDELNLININDNQPTIYSEKLTENSLFIEDESEVTQTIIRSENKILEPELIVVESIDYQTDETKEELDDNTSNEAPVEVEIIDNKITNESVDITNEVKFNEIISDNEKDIIDNDDFNEIVNFDKSKTIEFSEDDSKFKKLADIKNIYNINDKIENSKDGLDEKQKTKILKVNPNYELPEIDLLKTVYVDPNDAIKAETFAQEQAEAVISVFKKFNVDADIKGWLVGPSVIKFEITVGEKSRVKDVLKVESDLQFALKTKKCLLEAPIEGKNAVGLTIPSQKILPVSFKEAIEKMPTNEKNSKLFFPVGKGVDNKWAYAKLEEMPHLLIAGSTGSGKSVMVNSIICSILMRAKPYEVKLLMIDPKRVELAFYDKIPHLLAPVISDMNLAGNALKNAVAEMELRYQLFNEKNVKHIEQYNKLISDKKKKLPYVIIIIDELADLMLSATKKDVEGSIQRLTQMARACGIHLIVATQRPSVDVITGVIKSNIPSRISFAVSSAIDSRTILDSTGGETLNGKGDMLYDLISIEGLQRAQGCFINDDEIRAIVEFCKNQDEPEYDETYTKIQHSSTGHGSANNRRSLNERVENDPLLKEIIEHITKTGATSTSDLQRKFGIGYNRASSIIEQFSEDGIVGPIGSAPNQKRIVYLKE